MPSHKKRRARLDSRNLPPPPPLRIDVGQHLLTMMTFLRRCLPQESVKHALIGVCRDLRGVTAATNNRRSYGMLFDVSLRMPVVVVVVIVGVYCWLVLWSSCCCRCWLLLRFPSVRSRGQALVKHLPLLEDVHCCTISLCLF